MLADARAGKFDVILAWQRIGCIEVTTNARRVGLPRGTGIDIELAKETFDKNIAPVKAWAARMELQAKHDRLMMGVAGKLASGNHTILDRPTATS